MSMLHVDIIYLAYKGQRFAFIHFIRYIEMKDFIIFFFYRRWMMMKPILQILKYDTSSIRRCMYIYFKCQRTRHFRRKYIFLSLTTKYKKHYRWSSSFSIDNKTGNITVKERPTITTGQIELIVEAQDLGVPPLQSSVAVLVCFACFLFLRGGMGVFCRLRVFVCYHVPEEIFLKKQKHMHIDHILTPISDG